MPVPTLDVCLGLLSIIDKDIGREICYGLVTFWPTNFHYLSVAKEEEKGGGGKQNRASEDCAPSLARAWL